MLKLENVSFKVDVDGKNLEIIDNVNIEVPDGAFTVITGPNGDCRSVKGRRNLGLYEQRLGERLRLR